jgi:5'-3' exonuclease
VPGVGDKTAAALINTFGTVANVVAAAEGSGDGFAKGVQPKVVAALDYLSRAHAVVQVARDVPLGEYDARLPREPKDPQALIDLVATWGIRSSVNRVLAALAQVSPE